jgi:cyclic beta-1,2-glucan synthetase
VWLAWFLITTLRNFAPYAEKRGDTNVASTMRSQADAYVAAVEASGWDGGWYRRAYFDDGTPMGSASSNECRIDSIAQSWSVISGAGLPTRQETAMKAVDAQLVLDDVRLIKLLTPPFDRGTHDPGYIKGYVPGVRENGAQYTHAALWTVQAKAMQGDGDRAFALFQMLNPLTHGTTAAQVERYKAEPYVVAADVYTAPAHRGRGGWTWYTGSASWMYRIGIEYLLGFTRVGDTLRIIPNVPGEWPSFTIRYAFGTAIYVITVTSPGQVRGYDAVVTVDGTVSQDGSIRLIDDGREHTVNVQGSWRRSGE